MTRVLIVASIRLYREGIAQLLDANGEFTVAGTESTGQEAIERLDETAPDVVLVDMDIPDLRDAAAGFAARSPRIPVVGIGIADSEAEVLACAEMGMAGYVTRESSIAELATAGVGCFKVEGRKKKPEYVAVVTRNYRQSLDAVASALETLGSDDRMVGIVTHVRELAERVPVRYEVVKGSRSSTITRVDA